MSGFDIGLEFLPPQNFVRFKNIVAMYTPIDPSIISVTFHTRPDFPAGPLAATFETIPAIREVLRSEGLSQTPVAAHLTCKGVPINKLKEIADDLWERNIKDLVVLTGDLKEGETMPPGFYTSSTPLVEALFERQNFDISVAGHPRFISDKDMDGLKKKIDAGATRIITQYDFEAENYLRFEEKARASGIRTPIAHGVMPIGSFDLVARLAKDHKVPMPDALAQRFLRHGNNNTAKMEEARIFFDEQLQTLKGGGTEAIHVYTLGRVNPAMQVLPDYKRRSDNVTHALSGPVSTPRG